MNNKYLKSAQYPQSPGNYKLKWLRFHVAPVKTVIVKKTSHKNASEDEERLSVAAGNVNCHYGNQIPQEN